LVQTAAVDFAVASTGNLETFDNVYQIFSIPYLFDSVDVYHKVMEDDELMSSIFESTEKSGFQAVAWYEAGTRNFYSTSPIKTPEDLKGKKIRVQQSPTNVRMMQLFAAAAAPMSFGEVYTAIQSGVIDGGENNELALTNNKHGEVAKYYTYNQHQMVPDLLVGNVKFLNELPVEERKVFDEAAKESTRVEREAWEENTKIAIEDAKAMGVEFIETDVQKFKEKVLPLHEELLLQNSKLKPIYKKIQQVNKEVKEQSNMKSLKKVLNKILKVVCIAIFAFITIIGLYQIITRYVFNAPSTVSEELLTFSFTWMALLAAALVLVYGGIEITKLTSSQVTASLGVPMSYIYSVIPVTGVLIVTYNIINITELLSQDKVEKSIGREEK
jgi:tripartite ATP-independent transporter DctP family solute receptor